MNPLALMSGAIGGGGGGGGGGGWISANDQGDVSSATGDQKQASAFNFKSSGDGGGNLPIIMVAAVGLVALAYVVKGR